VTIVVPEDNPNVQWAAVENVIKKGAGHPDMEMSEGGGEAPAAPARTVRDIDDEL
jgi:hypothetical protein